MISAAEARKLSKHVWTLQLEQIERAIKETIIMGGTCIYYETDMLKKETIEWLKRYRENANDVAKKEIDKILNNLDNVDKIFESFKSPKKE